MEYPPTEEILPHMPPNEPWEELSDPSAQEGYLSYYLSDDVSKYAVREVTRPNDNKSDPNLETMSYGLFSTCERGMRAGAVNSNRPYIFFLTKRGDRRYLTGYYHIKWFTEGHPVFSYLRSGKVQDDYILVADKMKFVHPPIPMEEIAERFNDEFFSKWFRTYKITNEVRTADLLEVIDQREDVTKNYLDEIERLELVNRRYHDYRYTNWEQNERFSWEMAASYLFTETDLDISEVQERFDSISSEDVSWWECLECGHEVESERPLKRCPNCNTIGTQIPLNRES